jgi:hypothetical protein
VAGSNQVKPSQVKLFPILAALSRAVRREVGSFRTLTVNNFFFFIALMAYSAQQSSLEPKSAYPFLLLLLIVMLFPLSSDPLDKVPPSRRALWPLSSGQRIELRIASVLLSPVLWLAIALMLFRRIRPATAMAFFTAVAGVQIVALFGRAALSKMPRWSALKYVPSFPGKLGGLIRNHLRQLFQVLDSYVALILVLASCAYRFLANKPDPEAFSILALMIALIMSTYAQCLFGLDPQTRYRLFPLHGWEVLLSKDVAFLALLLVLVLPLDPIAGLTFGLFALAVGHHASVFEQLRLRRWRFSGGRAYIGVIQCIGGFVFGISAHRVSPAFLFVSAAAWLISLVVYGWLWGRHSCRRAGYPAGLSV